MNKNDFIKGSTRCIDSTAMTALRNIEKEGGNMASRTGEIWDIEMASGDTKEGIIIADHGSICTILLLQEMDNGKGDLVVNCRGEKYTDSRRVQYCTSRKAVQFIRKLTDSELTEIKDKIVKTFGIEPKKVIKEIPAVAAAQNDKAEIKHIPNMELECTKAQLELYKTMYNDLLKLTMKGAV